MPSTFTTNNGIELIATGEQSGTWGSSTNDNLDLIDTALDGQVTVTLPSAGSSGSPNSLAISNGVASDGRNRQITFASSGDLGATAFVQLTPNDAKKVFVITNSLDGGQSVILFQGTYSASNDLELANGQTAMVKFDGAGSGAVVTRLISDVGTPDNVAITGGSIDGVAITGGSISGITDIAVADGGTGASDASGARTNLGLVIGTNVQAFSSVLSATTASYTTAEETKLSGIEAGADVTDTASVTAAGALMDSEVDADIKTLSLPANTTISAFGASIVDDADAAAVLTTLGLTSTVAELNFSDGVTSNIQTQIDGKEDADPEILKADVDDNLTAGYTSTADNDGTKSGGFTYTPDPAGGNLKRIVNGGTFQIGAPTAAGDYTMIIQMTNNASAAKPALTGFTKTSGATLTTTNGDDFLLYITKINGFTSVFVEALQ